MEGLDGMGSGGNGAGADPLVDDISDALQVADELMGVAQPDLDSNQQSYVRYSTMEEAHPLPEWRQQDSLLAEATANFGDPAMVRETDGQYPLSAALKIVQAPAAFARPMVQRKAFKPPFKVQLQLVYRGVLSLPIRVEAFTLADTQVSKPATWKPDQNPQQVEIENARIVRHLQVPSVFSVGRDSSSDGMQQEGSKREGGGGEEKVHVEEFEFTDLRFIKSSRMTKRWLAFTCRLKDDLLYTMYGLPSVIISRRTDQYSKAYETLMGQPPVTRRSRLGPSITQAALMSAASDALPRMGCAEAGAGLAYGGQPQPPIWTTQPPEAQLAMDEAAEAQPPAIEAEYVHSWLLRKYQNAGFTRPLSRDDVDALKHIAGFGPPADEGSDREDEEQIDAEQWLGFREWFVRWLRALKQLRGAWNCMQPTLICGWGVEREGAEEALAPHPTGTFLLRMCEEPGCIAMSVVLPPEEVQAEEEAEELIVEHFLFDAPDFQQHSLDEWVAAMGDATHLLDLDTGLLHLREDVFLLPAASDGATGLPDQPVFDEADGRYDA